MHRSLPPPLNFEHRCPLVPVDYAEDTVALTGEGLSVRLKAHRTINGLFSLRLSSESLITTATSGLVSTLLLLPTALNSANRVPEASVNIADVSPALQRFLPSRSSRIQALLHHNAPSPSCTTF
ncbi:hypothetical protein D9611_010317 [Ephemerocybe angulata]|uniref:Uncharacterized protein n=1 Tax=Ephemerocybe angulata TaxID=980116 RepID=A0A8H5BBA6_9AGAR|nr:hypothetical protein D9611_010317 [Tulosesus angulatus]